MTTPLARRLLVPVWIVLLSIPIAAAFALTALLFAWGAASLRVQEVPVGQALLLGVLCGLIAWLFVAVFHLRREVLCLPIHDAAFRERVRAELAEMGYKAPATMGDVAWFNPGVTSFLVGGAIKVHWGPVMATFSGPRVFLEILRRRLRMDEHIRSVRQTVADAWVRQGRSLLKRVEVNLRVPPDRWQDVHGDVIEVLARDGARIVCMVSILAQSDVGIVRDTVDVVIRDRLRQKHLDAEIRMESRLRTDPMIVLPDMTVPTAAECPSPIAG